ncbi:MAG: hypothetical protein J0L70_18370 [Leptolyngbya sp. UWPOB_LEPTO1]|uniref:hypothetical protein n=1 Tax=Leptolyngbya sp. UWPOB_LEPTO1 TaxID=2815653 RepID=UPI001ACB1E2F|nr:hypothetical protein [Leptolyngbya sp. UWPOB_LEPTO1]MBN8562501.1 hypothetical protein [Leptolyngbya sp. UWPOB_LEPTO1]
MDALKKLNDRLKAACIPVRVIPKGKNLGLRATLPKKPEHGGIGQKQYDISLRIPASKDGLKEIWKEALKLGQLITERSFTWETYIQSDSDPDEKTIAQWLDEFKTNYFKTHRRIKEPTWNNNQACTFRKLPLGETLSEPTLLAVILSTEEDSRNRELTCQRLQNFATFAGLKVDLLQYIGEYEPKARDLPDDETIVEWRDKIPNEQWKWAYGAMAAFGIRPHEVFACEPVDELTLKVHGNTKTGARITHAIRPEWAKQWNLIEMNAPQTTQTNNRLRGQLVSHQFGSDRYNLPFVPYDLRHAWAIRASVVEGLPVSTAAALMGHAPDVHMKVYHRWLSAAENERVYRSYILKKRD